MKSQKRQTAAASRAQYGSVRPNKMAAKSKYLTNSNHDAAQETPGFPSAQNSCYRDESPEVAELHLGGHTSVSSAKKRRTWN